MNRWISVFGKMESVFFFISTPSVPLVTFFMSEKYVTFQNLNLKSGCCESWFLRSSYIKKRDAAVGKEEWIQKQIKKKEN